MPMLGEPQQDPNLPYGIAPEILAERRRQQEADQSRLKASSTLATTQSPDAEAEVRSLSDKTGINPDFVRQNIDSIRARVKADDPALARLPEQSPKTAAFLSDPSNAAVAADDHATLTFMEGLYRMAGNSLSGTIARRTAGGLYSVYPAMLGLLEGLMKRPSPAAAFELPIVTRARAALGGEFARARQQVTPYTEKIVGPRSNNPWVEAALQAPESIGQMIPAIGLGILAGPGAGLALMGATTAGQAIGEALDKGVDPTKALVYGGLMGGVEVGTEVLPAHLIFDQLKVGGKAGQFIAKLLGEELIGEEIATAGQNALQWAYDPENKNKTLGDYWREGAFAVPAAQTFITTALNVLGIGGLTTAASHYLHNKTPQEAFLEQEAEALKNSPVTKRSPETTKNFIDSTGALPRYVAPEKIRERAQSAKLDPNVLAASMTENGQAKLEEATRNGTDIEIPASDYALRVGQSEHAPFFNRNTRVGSPEVATAEEAEVVRETALQDLTPEEIAQQETIQTNLALLESPEVAQAIEAASVELTPPAAATAEATLDYWQGVADRATERIRARGTLTGERLGSGIDPADIVDVLKFGTAKLVIGVRNFSAWSQEMIQQYGPQVRPYLRSLYAKSVAQAAASLNLSPEAIKEAAASALVDDAVTQAEADAGSIPLYMTAAEMGKTEEEFAEHQATMEAASLSRREKIQAETRRSLARENADWYQAKRETVKTEVAAELNVNRDQQALAYLSKGTLPNGEPLEIPAVKLDQKALEQRYKKHAESPEMQALHKLNAYRKEGGAHPDATAEKLGYASGDEMVQAVIATPKYADAVEAETNRRMTAEYGDVLNDPSLDQRARDAVMVLGRSEIIADEMKAYLKSVKESGQQLLRDLKAIRIKDARAAAEARVAQMQVRDLNPRLHYAAARKASTAARDAFVKGDAEAVWNAKNKEITNVEMYRATRNALDRIEEARQESKAYFRNMEQLTKTRTEAFVQGARSIMAQLFFPNRAAPVAEAMKLLQKYDPQQYEMVDLQLPPLQIQDWSQAPYQIVSDMIDIAESLWEQSSRDKKVRVNLELIDRAEVVQKLLAPLKTMSRRFAKPGVHGLMPPMLKWGMRALKSAAWVTRMESWVTLMDGGPTGPYRTYFLDGVMAGTTKFRLARNEFYGRYLELRKPVDDTLTSAKIAAPELEYTWGNDGNGGKAELLGAMMHAGNRKRATSNTAKYLVSRGWAFYESDGTLNTSKWDGFMTRMEDEGVIQKRDWDFVQAVWDLFEELKPDLQQAHQDLYGFRFEETPADAFTNRFGTYRGGYVPVILDAVASQGVAEARAEKQMTFEADTAVALPSVGRANTISRVITGKDFIVAANLSFIPQHIDWALRFAYIQPAIKDASKLIQDPTFRDALNAHNPVIAHTMVIPWLSRTAQQRVTKRGEWTEFDRALSKYRSRTSLQILGGAVGNTLQQFTGLIQLAQKLQRPRYLVWGALNFMHHPIDSGRWVAAKSAYMRSHIQTDLHAQMHRTLANATLLGRGTDFVQRYALILQQGAQSIVNTIGWTAAYNDASRQYYDENAAIRYADSAIRETQGAATAESISRLEAAHAWVKIFNFFSGYPMMNLNLTTVETINAYRNNKGMFAVGSRVMTALGLTWYLPSVVSQIILNAVNLGDPWDDDDDDTHVDEVLNLLIGSPVKTAFSAIPVAGGIFNAALNAAMTSSRYDDDIRISPFAQVFQSAIDDIPKLMKIESAEDLAHLLTTDKQLAKHFLSIIGVFSDMPMGAPWITRPLGYAMDVGAGKAEPEGPLDVALGVMRGREVKK